MSTRIEQLMINSIESLNGWTKTTTPENDIVRTIRIGTCVNCNGDSIICDNTIVDKIKNILRKYNIKEYELKTIHTQFEFSTQISLNESVYQLFIENLAPRQISSNYFPYSN